MPNYISKFKGSEIDEAIGKTREINKTSEEINQTLEDVENLQQGINNVADGELLSKGLNGDLKGTGVIDQGDKIFFTKDARLPSGSIDIGPSITLSEASGWLRVVDNSTNDKYFAVDSKNTLEGSERPIYYEHSKQEELIVQSDDTQVLNNVSVIEYTPKLLSQVNEMYLNFESDVKNLRIEVISMITNKPIKYIPSEGTWVKGVGGLNLVAGVQNIFLGFTFTPVLFEPTTPIKINLVADNPINLKGNETLPYIKAKIQRIYPKALMLQEDLEEKIIFTKNAISNNIKIKIDCDIDGNNPTIDITK